MKQAIAAVTLAALVLIPTLASASFYQSAEQARVQVSGLSQQQLDSLNSKVFADAFVAAKIVGFDRNEIDQIKAQLHALQVENAQLRAQLSGQPAAAGTAPASLEARVVALEKSLTSLQGTLSTIVSMLTVLLTRLT